MPVNAIEQFKHVIAISTLKHQRYVIRWTCFQIRCADWSITFESNLKLTVSCWLAAEIFIARWERNLKVWFYYYLLNYLPYTHLNTVYSILTLCNWINILLWTKHCVCIILKNCCCSRMKHVSNNRTMKNLAFGAGSNCFWLSSSKGDQVLFSKWWYGLIFIGKDFLHISRNIA